MSGRLANELIRDATSDEGFPFDINIPLRDFRLVTTAVVLTNATSPPFTLPSTGEQIVWAAGNSAHIFTQIQIPRVAAWRLRRTDNKVRLNFQLRATLANAEVAAADFTIAAFLRRVADETRNATTQVEVESTGVKTTGDYTAITKSMAGAGVSRKLFDFGAVDTASGTVTFPQPGDDLILEVYPGTHAAAAISLFRLDMRIWCNANVTDETKRGPWLT